MSMMFSVFKLLKYFQRDFFFLLIEITQFRIRLKQLLERLQECYINIKAMSLPWEADARGLFELVIFQEYLETISVTKPKYYSPLLSSRI